MAGANYTLGQLLDLALGTPEIGAVNFNILHRLLNAVLTRLDIREMRVPVDADFDMPSPLFSADYFDMSPRKRTSASKCPAQFLKQEVRGLISIIRF